MVEEYFRTYAGYAKRQSNGTWSGGCPSCREGNSWGRKRRLFYDSTGSKGNTIYCFNCCRHWTPVKWMMDFSGKSFKQIMDESKTYDFASRNLFIDKQEKPHKEIPVLPYNSINLGNEAELQYYRNNPMVQLALDTIKKRRLDTARNKVTYYLSLTDRVHKNRLVIPFKGVDDKIAFYQSRTLLNTGKHIPKYLSKMDSPKTLFGIDKIDLSIPYMVITEGPIDACFIPNGVAVTGLNITELQRQQMDAFFTLKKIWVLDNDFRDNKDVLAQYHKLISDGETVFIWPLTCSKYKDVNELCVDKEVDEIPIDLIVKNSYSGEQAENELKKQLEITK